MRDFLRRHSHTNWALADQALVSGVTFLTGILLARQLGIAEFGRFSLAWMAVLFVQGIQNSAISAPMMSIGPKQESHQHAIYYGGVFFGQLVFGCTSTVVAWAIVCLGGMVFTDWNIATIATPLAATVLLCQTQDFLRRYFFTIQRPAVSFVVDGIRYVGQLGILVWVFFVSRRTIDLNATLWIIAGAAGAGAGVALTCVPGLEWSPPLVRKAAFRNWRFSKWLVGSAVVQWLGGNLFVVTAGALLGVAAVGALKAAQSLIGVTHILFQGLENVVPVRAAQRYHRGGAADLVNYLARVTRLGMGATAIIACCFALDPALWFRLVLGKEFAEYSYLLRWYAALYVLMFLTLPMRFGLRAIEKTAPVFVAYLVAAVFSVAATYPLVKEWGLTGVLLGLFANQFLLLGVMFVPLSKALSGGRT